jgi:hypothetical protein
LECKWHSGQEADLVCLKCGQPYCRECVKETREAHYCPDCHQASVQRLAMQMGGRSPKVKEPKPVKAKEPKVAKEKPVKEPKESRKLRKPADKPMGPTLDDLAVAPPPPVEPPAPSLTPEERAAFWSDSQTQEKVAPFTPVQQAPPTPPQPRAPAQQTAAPRPAEPMRVEGMPPPLVDPTRKVTAPPVAEPLVPPDAPPPASRKRPVPKKEEREAAVMAAEGFPTTDALEKGGKYRGAKAANEVMSATDGTVAAEETLVPESRLDRRRSRRRQSRAASLPVAMQVPEDYDGEVTTKPSYIKAILFGMGAGLITSAAFAGLAWAVHKDLGIFGWIIGLCVGVAVAFGSGRHFNWKLGLIAAVIAMFWVSIERIGYFMLDVRFNSILRIPYGIWQLFRMSFTTYYQSFTSIWLLFFILSGAVAFLVAFRPPPIRMQLASSPPHQAARHGS